MPKGCMDGETWTMVKEEIRIREAFTVSWYRRMQKISRTDRIANVEF